MKTLRALFPVAVVAVFPTLLLVLRSDTAIRIVVFSAVAGLSDLAGESISRVLPRSVMTIWASLAVAGILAAIALGWLEQGESLAVNLGKLAAIAFVLGVPIRALVVRRWPRLALGLFRTESGS